MNRKRQMTRAALDAHVAKALATAPPLSDAARDDIARLMRTTPVAAQPIRRDEAAADGALGERMGWA